MDHVNIQICAAKLICREMLNMYVKVCIVRAHMCVH